MNEPLSKIMITDLKTVSPEATLDTVRELFQQNRIHHLPVVEGKKLVGMVSVTDLYKLGRSFDEYRNIRVKEVMTDKVGTLYPNEQIGAAAEVFLENLFHAVPIVNEERELMGLVTTFDVLKYQFDQEYPKR
jgi:CBS domain-containing protein